MNNTKKVDGYARVITDFNGNISYVEEYYSFDEKLNNYIACYGFNKWIENISHKNSEVLITYNYCESKYCIDNEYEVNIKLNICDIIVLGENYNQKIINKIKKYKNELENIIKINNDIYDCIDYEQRLEYLMEKYEEIYKEEFKE